ncbi:EutN/CcmL family microcompartment protein [bacterium]|nr:EutN/CcmL family microcompartment protein [bacterium]
MQRARVIGQAVSTIKHPSMPGHKLLLAQPLGVDNRPDEFPILIVDSFGAGIGSTVIITSDGKFAREITQSDKTPVRYTTVGLEDD